MAKIIASVVLTLAGLLIAGLAYLYAGGVNIAADSAGGVKDWLLHTAMRRSVEVRADEIRAPDLSGSERVERSIAHYDEMCAQCHGAPGRAPDPFARGIHPAPPQFARQPSAFEPPEMFWIVKHGIQMTAMPAWGTTHGDEELWDLVAIVQQMPDMDRGRYRELLKHAAPHGHDGEADAEKSAEPESSPTRPEPEQHHPDSEAPHHPDSEAPHHPH